MHIPSPSSSLISVSLLSLSSLCVSIDPSYSNSSEPPSDAMAETVVLKVTMSCEGCVGAVKRVLTKMEGVETFDVDIKEQKVTVKGNVTPDDVFKTVAKTGKKTAFWETEAEEVKEAPKEVAAEAQDAAAATA